MSYARPYEQTEAFLEGEAANRLGQRAADCAYPLGDEQRNEWLFGWCNAAMTAPISTHQPIEGSAAKPDGGAA